MKSLERTLQQLFKIAALAPTEMPGQPPFALETRVLAGWRSGPLEDEFAFLATVFQRAIICASLVMILSAGWSWFQNRQQDSGATALANYTISIQLMP